MEVPTQNKPIIDIAAPPKPATTPPPAPATAPNRTQPASVSQSPTPLSVPQSTPPAAMPVAHQQLAVHKAPVTDDDTSATASANELPAADPASVSSTQSHTTRSTGPIVAVVLTIVGMMALSAIAILIYVNAQK